MAYKARPRTESRFDYVCQTKRRQGVRCCSCPSLDGQDTDQKVLQALQDLLPENMTLQALLSEENAPQASASPCGENAILRKLVRLAFPQILWDGATLTLQTDPPPAAQKEGAVSRP
jgi:hypothetical protein